MRPIVHVPNQILTTSAQTVTAFDHKLENLISEMKGTLKATVDPKGVGLAAPQVGVSLRVFLTRPTEKEAIRVFINPEIIKRSESLTDGLPAQAGMPDRGNNASTSLKAGKLEGCLSIPNIWGKVRRASSLTLKYQDETGAIRQEQFSGFLATIIQHETDHVNGILFTQRVLEQKEKVYQAAKDVDGNEVLEEIKLH
jgi:peptide deformylase